MFSCLAPSEKNVVKTDFLDIRKCYKINSKVFLSSSRKFYIRNMSPSVVQSSDGKYVSTSIIPGAPRLYNAFKILFFSFFTLCGWLQSFLFKALLGK